MAQKSSFFNANLVNGNYDRVYDAGDWAQYFTTFLSNGISHNPESALQVEAGTAMEVIVAPGVAFINGYRYENTEPLTISLNPANSTYGRITSIVVELNLSNRNIEIVAVDGAVEPSPTAPTLIKNSGIYQLQLAEIEILAGSTEVVTSSVTDTRANKELCGYIEGLFGEDGIVNLTTEVDKLSSEVNNLSNTALTESSNPTLSNNWFWNNSMGPYFCNTSGTAVADIQVNSSNMFLIANNLTSNGILGFEPVSSGTDTLNIYGYADFSENVTVNDDLVITENDGYLVFEDDNNNQILNFEVSTSTFNMNNVK
ncbi:MAG: hypothetical protein ACRDD2_11135, partial [Sarcina sp.]